MSLSAEPGARRGPLETAAFLVVLLVAVHAVTTNRADADLWGHVRYGSDLLEQGVIASTASYTYTAEGYPWINHENLAEVAMAVVARTLGPVGLVVGKSLLVYVILALVIGHAFRRGVGLGSLSLCLLVIAVNLTPHVNIRPQLMTYFLFAGMLALLAWCFEGWEGRWAIVWKRWGAESAPSYSAARLRHLWWCVPLFVVWTNAHGGFVAGLCVWSAYLGCRIFESLTFAGAARREVACRLGLAIAAAWLATFVNPYGPGLHFWLRSAVGRPRPEIAEWHPPHLDDPASAPFWLLLGATLIAIAMTRRSRDFTHLSVTALLIAQACSHQRHACFVTLGFAFWHLPHVDSFLRRFNAHEWTRLRAWDARPWARSLGLAAASTAALAIGWSTAGRLSDLTVDRAEFPVGAVEYMAERRIEGNCVAHFDWAQYVLDALGARDVGQLGVRLAFDGRFRTCYPQSVIDAYFDFALGNFGPDVRYRDAGSGRYDDDKILSLCSAPHGPAELVLIAKWLPLARGVMRERGGEWVLLYQDDVSELWGRADRFDDPNRPEYIPPSARRLAGAAQAGTVTWPAKPDSAASGTLAAAR